MAKILNNILNTVRINEAKVTSIESASSWGLSYIGCDEIRFHLSFKYPYFIKTNGKLHEIPTNALVMIKQELDYSISDHSGQVLNTMNQENNKGHYLINKHSKNHVVYAGSVSFNNDSIHPILGSLPDIVTIENLSKDDEFIRLAYLANSGISDKYYSKAIKNRMNEVAFMMLLNRYILTNDKSCNFIKAVKDPKLNRLLDSIHNNKVKCLDSVTQLGQSFGMSTSTMMRYFKKFLGTSPKKYICKWQLMQAHQKIKESQLSIDEIAEHAGYSNIKTFTKAFEKHFHYTPFKLKKDCETQYF